MRAGVVAAIAAGAVAAGVALTRRNDSSTTEPATTIRFEVLPPPGALWSPSPVASTAQLALSPDGRRLAFVAAARGSLSQVWIRSLDAVEAKPLAGTEGASYPFWSPDSRSIGFFAGGKLNRIDTAGGAPQPLGDAPSGRGGTWNRDGVILFTGAPSSGILRVAAAGGAVTEETALSGEEGAVTHYWPQFLMDGRRFLYWQRSSIPEFQAIYVKTLGAPGATRVLATSGMAVAVPGYLLTARDEMLFAHPFDDGLLQTTGEPIRVANQVGEFGSTVGYAAFSASPGGALAHGPGIRLTTILQWRDRSGGPAGPQTPANVYRSPRLSPDQKSVVVSMQPAGTRAPDIWMLELTRGTFSRLTADPLTDWFPTWSPDGARVFFGSTRTGSTRIFQQALNAVAQEEAVTEPANAGIYPNDVSGDGRLLVVHGVASGGYDLGILTIGGDRTLSKFFADHVQRSPGPLLAERPVDGVRLR